MGSVGRLSTEEAIKVARERFVQISSMQQMDISMLTHFFKIPLQSGLSAEDIKYVELAILLVAAADIYDDQHYYCSAKFLNLCAFFSTSKGSPVQRVVHYFTMALQERLDRETGMISESKIMRRYRVLHPQDTRVTLNPSIISFSLKSPHIQVSQFVGIQAVVDNVASARKVHVIDLAIRSGGHSIVLMQALANREQIPIELLKITAVGTTTSKRIEEMTGKELGRFAVSLDLPLSFKAVTAQNLENLRKEMFEIDDDEVVVIFSRMALGAMKARTNCSESVMPALKSLNPSVMVVIEYETNDSSPIFKDRFLSALNFYSACFDFMEECMDRDDQDRAVVEACFGQEIRDVLVAEDDERIFRHMKIDDWRALFANFGIEEIELSTMCLDQADLVRRTFSSAHSFSIERNGKAMVTANKGTPILSISAWKFI